MASMLFRRKNEVSSDDPEEEEDAWDDSVLVEAYDKAVKLAREEVERRMQQGGAPDKGAKKKKRNSKAKKDEALNPKTWEVGMPCQAVYTEDGEFYEAVIESLSLEEETCSVKFLGYNNCQQMSTGDLFKTQGKEAVRKQIQRSQLAIESEAQAAAMEWTSADPSASVKKEHLSHTQQLHLPPFPQIDSSIHMAIPPPPPISQLTAHLPADEAEALSSMCMSWYLNGFHTGYFLAMKQQPK